MATDKVQIQGRVPKKLIKEIEKIKDQKGQSWAIYMQRLLEAELERHKKPK